MNDRRLRTFVLGAGFSHLAGFPLGRQLWQQVLPRLDADLGPANHVRRDLEYFHKFKRDCTGMEVDPADVDFEEFIGFLDVEHYLGLRGSDTWSTEGNESQLLLKWYIGKTLWEHHAAMESIPAPYRRFAESLRPGDIVLTFNYDSLLEASLDAVGRPYRHFPTRFSTIGGTTHTVDSTDDEVVILKLHGSADWFDRSPYEEALDIAEETLRTTGVDYTPQDPIFGPGRTVRPTPIVDGPRPPRDPLNRIYRVLDPAPLYHGNDRRTAPFILSPSYSKILYSSRLVDFWHGLGRAGAWQLGMGIVGFSLPDHDAYVRQMLYALTGGYFDLWWGEEIAGKRKLPLRIVDFRQGESAEADLRQRFRFLDWSRTELFLDGFGERAIDFLFADQSSTAIPHESGCGHSGGATPSAVPQAPR